MKWGSRNGEEVGKDVTGGEKDWKPTYAGRWNSLHKRIGDKLLKYQGKPQEKKWATRMKKIWKVRPEED